MRLGKNCLAKEGLMILMVLPVSTKIFALIEGMKMNGNFGNKSKFML